MNVAAILNVKGRTVATAKPDTTLQDVATRLHANRIGAIVVVGADGSVEGIVSERDIIRAIAERGASCLSEAAARIMTREVTTCTRLDSVDHIMQTMTAGRFRHVPIVEAGQLIGIVSIGDVVKHHIAEVEQEASALKSYLVS